MSCRGIRGATTCGDNTAPSILAATDELLRALVEANGVTAEDVAAVFFTCSADLDAAFPARAMRALGYVDTALLCAREIDVPGAPARCVRVLMLVNTERPASAMQHVYLHGATVLRPDLAGARPAAPAPSDE